MSATLLHYDPVMCDGEPCPGDCDVCPKPEQEYPPAQTPPAP